MTTARSSHASFSVDSKLYVIGGRDVEKWLRSSDVFDVLNRSWSIGYHLPYALPYPKAVTNGNQQFSVVVGRNLEVNTKSYKKHGYEYKVLMFTDEHGFVEIGSVIFSCQDQRLE